MQEKKTTDIYDIDFTVLDKDTYEETLLVTQTCNIENESCEKPNQNSSVLMDEPTELEVAVLPQSAEKQLLTLTAIPKTVLDVAEKAISTVLETTDKQIIPIAMLVDAVYNVSPAKKEYEQLKNGLKQDQRLKYLGARDFKVIGREQVAPYWPDEDPNINYELIANLSMEVVRQLTEKAGTRLFPWQMEKLAKSLYGEYLNSDELNELTAQVASHPAINSHQNGFFRARLIESDTDQDYLPLNSDKAMPNGNHPIEEHQINKVLNSMRKSPELRKAKLDAKRLANPRRRGRRKKNKLQGRAHNQAKKIQELMLLLINSTPSIK